MKLITIRRIIMSNKLTCFFSIIFAFATIASTSAEELTIATVNNGDMIRMQGLTDDFTAKTGHSVEWVTLEKRTSSKSNN